MGEYFHLFGEGFSLLACLKYLHFCLLHVALQCYVLKFLECVRSDQAGDIVESHPNCSVAQEVEYSIFWVLFPVGDSHSLPAFCNVGVYLLSGEDGCS